MTNIPMFQPTHPHGVRQLIIGFKCMWFSVSTHAPARGATKIPDPF